MKSDSPQKEPVVAMPKVPKKLPAKTGQSLGKATGVAARGGPFSRKGTYAGSISEQQDEDWERALVVKLRNHNVFKDVGNLEPNEPPPLRAAPEATFKKICEDHLGGVESGALRHARIN